MERYWWETRWLLITVVCLSTLPLLWPQLPPLVDLPGHMGRYRVELDLANSQDLQRYFQFRWAVIGNLGVDLLILPMGAIFGLELAIKLIVIMIVALTVVGIFWTAAELHGRMPPTTFFAIPFVYGFAFNFGFINFSLSTALALIGFALWLRVRTKRSVFLFCIFIPASLVIWLAHAFGWLILGLLVWSSEFTRCRQKHSGWTKAAGTAILRCAPLAAPLLLMFVWRSGDVGGVTGAFLQFGFKFLALISAARDRWLAWDSLCVAVVVVLLLSAFFDKHLEFSPEVGIATAVLAFVFVIMPRLVFGSNYADMRLAPLILIFAILALRSRDPNDFKTSGRIAALGLGFALLRLGGEYYKLRNGGFGSSFRSLGVELCPPRSARSHTRGR